MIKQWRLGDIFRFDLWFLIKTSRPGFWSTTIWFYMLPVGQQPVFDTLSFWLGLVYVVLPVGLLLYGWNDVQDIGSDRLNPRKGTFLFGPRGSGEQLAVIPYAIVISQFPFLLVFYLLIGHRIIVWLLALSLTTAIYNWPKYGLKNHPFFDVLNQLGYLLIFVFSSWINGVSQLPWQTFVFGGLFAMHSHLFGQVMDYEPDRQAGRRTAAVMLGVIPVKLIIAGFLAIEAVFTWVYYRTVWISGFLLISAIWFFVDGTMLVKERSYTAKQMRFVFLLWNVIAFGTCIGSGKMDYFPVLPIKFAVNRLVDRNALKRG